MSKSRAKKLVLYCGIALFILLIIILSVYLIQREIRWKETRREMDIMEQEILQKIVITDNEKLPEEMMETLYTSIMDGEAEGIGQNILAYEVLTEEFLKRINRQMGFSLKLEDLEKQNYTSKANFERYGSDIEIVYYQFSIGEDTYYYTYHMNGKVTKTIDKGVRRLNLVAICNENNEMLNTIYSEWKNKYAAYAVKSISMNNYYEFMRIWDMGYLPKETNITIKNIKNVYLYK